MSIPMFKDFFKPVLEIFKDGNIYKVQDVVEKLIINLKIPENLQNERIKSGKTVIESRTYWAINFMYHAGILEKKGRGLYSITNTGKDIVADSFDNFTLKSLKKYPEFLEYNSRKRNNDGSNRSGISISEECGNDKTPEEILDNTYKSIKDDLSFEILKTVKGQTSTFFEKLVVDLVLKMGYGGGKPEAGKAVGKNGDGGIDGIINEDKLGLDVIYLQAKRYEDATIGRPEIQKFVGAMHGRAKKGIFITTSRFSKEAEDYASKLSDMKVILIDGEKLADFMIDYNVGVSVASTYEIKKIDNDYFDDI